jgi:hypothetical protein
MSRLSRIQSGLALIAAFGVMGGAPALQASDAVSPQVHRDPSEGRSRTAVAEDSLAARQTAERLILTFLKTWQAAWKASDTERFKTASFLLSRGERAGYLHCHPRSTTTPTAARPDSYPDLVRAQYRPIVSARGLFAKCPTWILGARSGETDEADSIDVALTPRVAVEIAATRRQLIADLVRLSETSPRDGWIIGQIVRFRLDHHDYHGTHEQLRNCRAARWWCDALRGYALHRQGRAKQADSAFLAAVAVMPEATRCEWHDVSVLLNDDDRGPFRRLTCAARDSLAARFFWLADPLLSDETNERRTEHYARHVRIALHRALAIDERYYWPKERGGDAVAEMMLRYGWPSMALWTGKADDAGHDNYVSRGARPASPYSTAEYAPGRLHAAPSLSAILSPSASQPEDWQLHSPAGAWATGNGDGTFWWPHEHMRERSRAIVQLPAPGQMAFLRRIGGVRVLAAMALGGTADRDLQPLLDHPLRMRSYGSSQKFGTERLSDTTTGPRGRLVLDGFLTTPAELFAVEAESSGPLSLGAAPLIARTRFGITPDPPLDSLARATISVSQPVLFAPRADRVLPVDADDLLSAMLESTTISVGGTVGVFWESYGLVAGDSLRVSLNLIPANAPGLLRRLATAVKLADPVSSVTVQWAEPALTSNRDRGSGNAATIRPRSVLLDLSALRPGEYWIEVVARVVAGAGPHRTATARRMMVIR